MKAERARAAAITEAAKAAKLGDDFARTLVDEGVSIEVARERIIAEFAKGDPHAGNKPHVRTGEDQADKVRAGIEEAILHRANPGEQKLKDAVKGSEFRGMSLLDLSREMIVQAGGNWRGLSDREVVNACLLYTSELPTID